MGDDHTQCQENKEEKATDQAIGYKINKGMFKKDIYLLPILPIRVTVKIDIEPLYIYFCAEKLILFRLP